MQIAEIQQFYPILRAELMPAVLNFTLIFSGAPAGHRLLSPRHT